MDAKFSARFGAAGVFDWVFFFFAFGGFTGTPGNIKGSPASIGGFNARSTLVFVLVNSVLHRGANRHRRRQRGLLQPRRPR